MSAYVASPRPLRWTVALARFGYGARGFVYILVGGLAVLAALGPGGETTDSRGALLIVLEQPLGWAWIGVIGVGLSLFTLWRLAQSLLDADQLGNSFPMLGRRAAYLVSALINAGLAMFALGLTVGLAHKATAAGESTADAWADRLMQLPYGLWIATGTGIAVAGAGVYFLWQSWAGQRVGEFLECPPDRRWWVIPAGRIGYAGRGLVFVLIGVFLALAGYKGRSAEARGLAGALDSLAAQPFGWILMGATAAALMAFGLYGLMQAFYRRIEPPPVPKWPGT